MYLLTLEEWITTVLVKALGWTFTHSLWQGLLAVLIAYASLAMMKKAKAPSRYNLLLGISLLFICAVVITFVIQLREHERAEQLAASSSHLQKILYNENSAATPVILESKRILDVVLSYFNQYLHLFVTAWFIIFCVKWLRLLLNLNYVNRISRFESAQVSDEWQQFVDKQKSNLGIRRNVNLLQSNIVKVPLVSGVFRPLILVPAGMLSNMPIDVIESILLHELAHIKRNDFLVNIIQSALETVFFFNPFIVKLSALIREEREACCDAIAVNATNNKVSYVQALVTFGEYSSTSAPLLAFAGTKNHLLQRVKRILYNQNNKPGIMEKSILLSSLIMLSVITAFTSIRNEKRPVVPVLQEINSFVNDTVPDETNVDVNENENVNADAVEPSKSENRKRQKRMRDAERKEKQKEKENLKEKQKQLEQVKQKLQDVQIQFDNEIQLNNEVLQKQLIELENKINIQNEKFMAQQEFNLGQAENAMKNVDMEKINRDVQKALKNIDMEKINKEMQAAIKFREIQQNQLLAAHDFEMAKQQFKLDSITHKLNLNFNIKPGYFNDDVNSILEFLEKNGVADAKDVKSFSLNNDELIVNGKKQAATLHQQLKERYIRDKDDHIIYSNSNGSKSITIKRNDPS